MDISNNFAPKSIASQQANATASTKNATASTKSANLGSSMVDMDMFLKLLASQLQNQDPMNPMKESDYLNQMSQMATIEAITTITDVSKTTYAASLVGKEVTLAEVNKDGSVEEVVGNVTGAGLYAGEQIIFVNNKSYSLSNIMCVGRLPEREEENTEDTDKTV